MGALVSYVRCQGFSDTWPAIKKSQFWASAAKFVSDCIPDHCEQTGTSNVSYICASGASIHILYTVSYSLDYMYLSSRGACCNKVLNYLRRKFKSPTAAEVHYFPLKEVAESQAMVTGSEINITPELQQSMIPSHDLKGIFSLFQSYVASNSSVNIPDDSLEFAVAAMQHLVP